MATGLAAWAMWYSVASAHAARPMAGVAAARGTASLRVRDQLGAQGSLRIDRVVAPDGSWVAVYLQGMGGMTGDRVGLVHVPAGETRDALVALDRTIRLTDRVIVVLHADRGVPSAFEFDDDRFDASPDKPYSVDGIRLSVPVVVRFSQMGNAV